MTSTLEIIAAYFGRVAPGLILGAMMLVLARREPRLRIIVYVALFVLLRDALTPLGLWSFGSQGLFWIRLRPDPWFLCASGILCLAMSLGLYFLDAENRPLFQWLRGRLPLGLLIGFGGALLVVAPLAVAYRYVPIEARGGSVPGRLVPAILLFTLAGNLYEEALFRGYVYGYLAQRSAPIKAGVASGVVFAFCHVFLAITVSDIGYPLLVFTLWEGVIAGIVGAKCGVLPATLTHGGAIFLLSSGLI